MKNFIILVFVIIVTVLLASLEYICGCPFEWPWGEFIGGVLLWIIGLVWSYRLHYNRKNLLMAALGGAVLIVSVMVASNAVYLWKMLFDAYPDMTDGFFISLTFIMAAYVPFVYIGTIWLYLYYFCDLREVFMQIKRDE